MVMADISGITPDQMAAIKKVCFEQLYKERVNPYQDELKKQIDYHEENAKYYAVKMIKENDPEKKLVYEQDAKNALLKAEILQATWATFKKHFW
jgi:hypothetical protein